MSNRRKFLQQMGMGMGVGLFGQSLAAGPTLAPAATTMPRKYVINGNMVIPHHYAEPLDASEKAKLKSTGLTAFKMSLGGSKGSYADALEILEWLPAIYSANPDVFTQVNSAADLAEAFDTQRIGIIYSFEAATMIGKKLERIAEFAKRGVRIMQPGYNNSNDFGAGVMSTAAPLGLTALGAEAIHAMQSSDVLVDLSHAHEQTGLDVLEIAKRPVAMTHTGCDAVNPHQRNKSDKMLKGIANSGGVVGIYEMSYLTADLEQQSLEAFMAHIMHAIKVCGEEHVGIGSDTPLPGFDTSAESLAQWDEINQMRKDTGVAAPGEGPPPYVVGLNGPHKMLAIATELTKRGVKPSAVDKIVGQNFARVFAEAW